MLNAPREKPVFSVGLHEITMGEEKDCWIMKVWRRYYLFIFNFTRWVPLRFWSLLNYRDDKSTHSKAISCWYGQAPLRPTLMWNISVSDAFFESWLGTNSNSHVSEGTELVVRQSCIHYKHYILVWWNLGIVLNSVKVADVTVDTNAQWCISLSERYWSDLRHEWRVL